MESVNKLMSWLKQVRSLLFSIVSIIPLIILIINAFEFFIYAGYLYLNFPDWVLVLGEVISQINDISLMTLIILFALSKHYRWISKLSFVYLCLIWLTNTVYILSGSQSEIYFYAFSSIIYVTFVILTVRRLINR